VALPTTIASTKLPVATYYCGPFISSTGNVYAVLVDASFGLHVYKATDPTTSFTEADAAHKPAQVPDNCVWAIQNADVLSIAGGAGSVTPAYKFHQFDMATDLWSTTIVDKAIASPTIGAAASACISIVKRSDASFVAFFNGAKETLMGTGRDRVFYALSTDGGATWGTPVEVDVIAGVKRDAFGAVAVLGASDRTHFFYNDTVANAKHRSLSSANALDTEAAVITTGSGTHNYTNGISYVSGANTVVKVSCYDANSKLTNVWLNSDANPTINTNASFSDATIVTVNSTPVAGICVNGTTVHALWSGLTTTDLMHDSQTDGGAWGTDVNEWVATINKVSANVYTRSGSVVIGFLIDDGGTIKYNEIALGAAPPAVPSLYPPGHRGRIYYCDSRRTIWRLGIFIRFGIPHGSVRQLPYCRSRQALRLRLHDS
jgi:hypothetical protein